MQTNIELAGASGRAIQLPVSARRERQTIAAERPARSSTLFAVMKELKQAERWETMVWVGIAIAALVLLVMSFVFGMRAFQNKTNAARWGHRALPSGKKFVADAVDGQEMFGGIPVVAEFFSQ